MEGGGVSTDAMNGEWMASVSRIPTSCSERHRRSKSASDRNNDCARYRTPQRSHYPGKDCNESQIKQLQMHLHQEKSIRIMLERAIGRASSTLSPGHRHFTTKTRELITEIELLEEEILNREQHVLSLYRSIFDQCVIGSSSEQSSGMGSPAHIKNGLRKHPSIISSAFCSSKKFRLQPFQILSSIRESGKSNGLLKQVSRESMLKGNSNNTTEINSSDSKKMPNEGSCLARTLKDHLYQCPSKLSEEMVRCMASIFCWVRSEASSKPQKFRSPFLSRSSTCVVLPRRGAGDDQESSLTSVIEISSILLDESHYSSASYAINNYRLLVEQLERVDASVMESSAKLAFWINVYNSLVMHAHLAYGIPHTSLRRMALFHKAAYKIGEHIITAGSIEHSILCFHTPRIGRWFEAILSTAMRKKSGDEKRLLSSNLALRSPQPLVIFALCTGASSDPMLRVYTAKNVGEELEKAKRDFLQSNVAVKKSRRIFLPKILDRYAKEVSLSYDELLAWVSDNMDKKLNCVTEKHMGSKNKRRATRVIEWLPYNSKFRYVLTKNLAGES